MLAFLKWVQSKLLTINKLGQSGVISHGLIILILLVGIIAGLYLVQKNQIFRPKASANNIEFSGTCLTSKDGQEALTCSTIDIKFISPLETNQVSGVSIVQTAYAAGDKVGYLYECKDDKSKIYHKICRGDNAIQTLFYCPFGYGSDFSWEDCPEDTSCVPITVKGPRGFGSVTDVPSAACRATAESQPQEGTKETTRFRFAEDPTSLYTAEWRDYTVGGVTVRDYTFRNTYADGNSFIYAEFEIKDSQGNITTVSGYPFPVQIKLLKEE